MVSFVDELSKKLQLPGFGGGKEKESRIANITYCLPTCIYLQVILKLAHWQRKWTNIIHTYLLAFSIFSRSIRHLNYAEHPNKVTLECLVSSWIACNISPPVHREEDARANLLELEGYVRSKWHPDAALATNIVIMTILYDTGIRDRTFFILMQHQCSQTAEPYHGKVHVVSPF